MTVDMGNRLTDLRRNAGLSQEMLAEQLDVSRQAVSKWERGEACPDMENLIMLSQLYGVSLDMLLRGEEWGDAGSPPEDSGEEPQEPPAQPVAEEEGKIEVEKASQAQPHKRGVQKRRIGIAWLLEYPLTNLGVSLLFTVFWFGMIFFGWKVWGFFNYDSVYTIVNYSFIFGNCWGLVYLLPWMYRMMRSAMGKGGVYQPQDSRTAKFFKVFPYPVLIILLHVFGLTVGHTGWWLLYMTIPIYEWVVQSIFGNPVSRYQIALSFPISSCVLCFSCFLSICDGSFWSYFYLLLIPVYYAIVIGVWAGIKRKSPPQINTNSIE